MADDTIGETKQLTQRETMYAQFNRFELRMSANQARSASHQGECYQDTNALLLDWRIAKQLDAIGPEAIRQELQEYGAWDADELANDDDNRRRIVWIAACDIREELPA